jgi:hypothetical protein
MISHYQASATTTDFDCKKLDGDGEVNLLSGNDYNTPTFTEQHLHFDTNYHSCQRASLIT